MLKHLTVSLLCLCVPVLATPAMAKPKPPKALCVEVVGFGSYLYLAAKPQGNKLPLADGKLLLYLVQGETDFGVPLTGSGHMMENTFHFSVSGSAVVSSGHHNTYFFEGLWDVLSQTGTISWTVQPGIDAVQEQLDEDLIPVDCSQQVITH